MLRRHLQPLLIVALMLVSVTVRAESASTPICVLYPKTPEPFARVFQQIRGGIRDELNPSITSQDHAVGAQTTRTSLNEWLQAHCTDAVITLGRRPFQLLHNSVWQGKQLVGALYLHRDDTASPGVSLWLDPGQLKDTVSNVLPSVKRLFVAGPDSERTTYDEIKRSGDDLQLNFSAIDQDPQHNDQMARFYWNTLDSMQPRTDALLLDHRVDPDLLYRLIEKAWHRQLILISTTLSHVERGALLALHPNNRAMGQHLAQMARAQLNQHPVSLEYLKTISITLNEKVVNHLGLQIPDAVKRDLKVRLR